MRWVLVGTGFSPRSLLIRSQELRNHLDTPHNIRIQVDKFIRRNPMFRVHGPSELSYTKLCPAPHTVSAAPRSSENTPY
jgi:hypothetical protein